MTTKIYINYYNLYMSMYLQQFWKVRADMQRKAVI